MQFVYRKTDNTKFFIIFKGKRQIAKAFEESKATLVKYILQHTRVIKR